MENYTLLVVEALKLFEASHKFKHNALYCALKADPSNWQQQLHLEYNENIIVKNHAGSYSDLNKIKLYNAKSIKKVLIATYYLCKDNNYAKHNGSILFEELVVTNNYKSETHDFPFYKLSIVCAMPALKYETFYAERVNIHSIHYGNYFPYCPKAICLQMSCINSVSAAKINERFPNVKIISIGYKHGDNDFSIFRQISNLKVIISNLPYIRNVSEEDKRNYDFIAYYDGICCNNIGHNYIYPYEENFSIDAECKKLIKYYKTNRTKSAANVV